MNHPLVRRKFRATLFFLPSSWDRRYSDRVVENVRRVSHSLAVHGTILSRSHDSLSDISRSPFFLPSLLQSDFSFFTSRVTFSRILTSLIRFPPSTVFSYISYFSPSFFSRFFRYSFFLRLAFFLPHPRSISLRDRELGWI